MARFTVRVVLHKYKNFDDRMYAKLNGMMKEAGFARTIRGSDQRIYHLPPGEFSYEANIDIDYVRDHAAVVANALDSDNGILVTEGPRSWQGLH